MTDFLGDTAWLVGQPVPVASLGDAVINLSSCMLPAWPPAPTARRKDSRPLHPTAPPRADRRRQLQRTSGAGRGRAHAGRPGRPSARHTHTLSGASDTMGSDSGDGDGPAGSHGADSPGVGVAQPLRLRGRGSPPLGAPPVSPPPQPSLPVDPCRMFSALIPLTHRLSGTEKPGGRPLTDTEGLPALLLTAHSLTFMALRGIVWVIWGRFWRSRPGQNLGSMQVRTLGRRYSSSRSPEARH
jgi:hypothetical protein